MSEYQKGNIKSATARAEKAERCLKAIASGVPIEDEWSSAADFMEWVAQMLERFGFNDLRPRHYPEDHQE